MKKKTFIRLVELMKGLSERNTLLTDKLKVIFNDKSTWLYPYDMPINEIYEALEEEFGDKDDWLGWWCFEREYGKKKLDATYKNGKKIKLDTAEQLYKFLRKNYG